MSIEHKLEAAWDWTVKEFPFKGYIREGRKSGYFDMVRGIYRWAGEDATILDFGAGPCDKTALFAGVGFKVTAFDDLQDAWHKLDNNREKILEFARKAGIDYYLPDEAGDFTFPDQQYDVVMLQNVIEHFNASPRFLLNKLIAYVKPGGLLVISVPNAGNLRKRLWLLLGKTNYNAFEYFYWYPGLWRGHVREYVKSDLSLLSRFLGLKVLELSSYHLLLDRLPPYARPWFSRATHIFPGWRDTWLLVAQKPSDWQPHFSPDQEERCRAFGGQYYDYGDASFEAWEE